MIVICEECGKKYRIDPERIKGRAASFKCRACTHVILVSKPATASVEPENEYIPDNKLVGTRAEPEETFAPRTEKEQPSASEEPPAPFKRKKKGLGLRAKMMLLFLFVPLLLIVCAGLFYIWQLDQIAKLFSNESTKIVNKIAEDRIVDFSTAVAMQCKLYLMSHPELLEEDFADDMGFKTLAVQQVGQKGYTALYKKPGADGVWRTWVHVNPKIIGINMKDLEKSLGSHFSEFWKIYTAVENGKKSIGYYTWKDKDGKFRQKFMACSPIAGTPYVIAVTTYLDEFNQPVKLMAERSRFLIEQAKLIALGILGGAIVLIFLIITIYGNRIAGKIKSLTEIADRISVGELDIEIETTSRDEIGDLADAISRMQESIRLSIERLRRRR